MAKCIVFGGTGFIGSHLVNKLLDEGQSVTVFTREYSIEQKKHDRLSYFYGDFLNVHDLDEATKGQKYVFHLVSLTNPALSEEDPFIDLETNVKMTIHLLQACVKNGVKKIIYTSSGGSIYGNAGDKPIIENSPTKPVSPYAIGKQAIEGFLRYFYNKYELDYVVLRISNAYGEGQNTANNKHGVISVFMNKIINGEKLVVYGDGSMMRDYVEVGDLSSFMARHCTKKMKHHTYNLGSGVGTSVNEIIDVVEKVTGVKSAKSHIEAPASYVHSIVLDCSRVTKEFGDVTPTSLEVGVTKMWARYGK